MFVRRIFHFSYFFSLVTLAYAFTSCQSINRNWREPLSTDELIVVATTDFHGALEKAEGLAATIRALKAKYKDQAIYLDAGDLFQGPLEANLTKGRAVVQLFNAIGLDAAAVGNHELDYGPDHPSRTLPTRTEDPIGNLKARAQEATFAWLSANWVSEKTNQPIFKSHAIFQRAGKKVCVLGATTPLTKDITRPAFIRGTKFLPLRSTLEPLAARLRHEEKCDFVLLSVHAGLRCNDQPSMSITPTACRENGSVAEVKHLLDEVPPGTFDLVIAGHTHVLAQEVFNQTPVLESGSDARVVGVVHLSKKSWRYEFDPFIAVPQAANQPDITKQLADTRRRAGLLKARLLGHAPFAFEKNYMSETALGNLLADAVLDRTQKLTNTLNGSHNGVRVDLALLNAGGVRASIASGPIRYGDIYGALPFDNSIALVEIKGSELKQLLQIAFSGAHGVSPISGITVTLNLVNPGVSGPWERDLNGDGKKETWERNVLLEVHDNEGRPLQENRTYRMATLDFLAQGGDHQSHVYAQVPVRRIKIFEGRWIRDVVSDFIKSKKELEPSNFFTDDRRRVVWKHPVGDKP